MTGRPRTASDAAIFDAISAVIDEAGPAGLTLAAVADRVGVSAPALTQRFGTKRKMLLAYAAASAGSVTEMFEAARERTTPLAAMYDALVALASPATSRAGLANSLAFLQLDLTDPDFGERAARHSSEVRDQLHALVRDAERRGELAPTIESAVLADLVYTTYNGSLITWAIDGTGTLENWLRARLDAALAPHRPR